MKKVDQVRSHADEINGLDRNSDRWRDGLQSIIDKAAVSKEPHVLVGKEDITYETKDILLSLGYSVEEGNNSNGSYYKISGW